MTSRVPPWPVRVQVVAHDADRHRLQVVLASSLQGPPLPVQVLSDGHADALRITQRPLPARGSWGLVHFVEGNILNGVWMGAYSPNLTDAVVSDAASPFDDYESHYSGYWSWLTASGQYSAVWPDGTALLVGSGAVPTVYRHTVDANQQRQRTVYRQQDRVKTTPPPFPISILHPTGAQLSIGVSGQVSLTVASGQPLMLSGTGWSLAIDGSGHAVLTAVEVHLGGAGGKKIARDGDPISTGGTIQATSTICFAD